MVAAYGGTPMSWHDLNVRRIARLAAATILVACLSDPLPAQALKFSIRDVRTALDKPIPTRRPLGSPPVVREPQQLFASGPAPISPDPSLDLPLARLGLDAEGLLNVGDVPPGVPLVPGSPLVEFAMGGMHFSMALIEPVLDADFDAMHYTLVAPGTRNHARFTVSRSGPEIVGTVFLDGAEYRILPASDGRQLVFPVRLYTGEFRRMRPPDLGTRAGMLEARHLQIAWYADRQPPTFHTRDTGILHAYGSGRHGQGPPLGRIDVDRALRVTADGTMTADPSALATAVESFLNAIGHLTLINDPIRVAVSEARLERYFGGLENSGHIIVRQLIDGTPITQNLRIDLDREGDVFGFSGVLLRDEMAERPAGPPLTEAEVVAAALAAAADKYGVDWKLTPNAKLIYDFESVVSSARLVWDVELRSRTGCFLDYRVQLRADTGEVVKNDERQTILPIVSVPREAWFSDCRAQP